jgi:hypothetical protein
MVLLEISVLRAISVKVETLLQSNVLQPFTLAFHLSLVLLIWLEPKTMLRINIVELKRPCLSLEKVPLNARLALQVTTVLRKERLHPKSVPVVSVKLVKVYLLNALLDSTQTVPL